MEEATTSSTATTSTTSTTGTTWDEDIVDDAWDLVWREDGPSSPRRTFFLVELLNY